MLTNVFENRNRYFANLVKLADFLGRSLRENVEVFSVEGEEVTFITENNKVIKGLVQSNKPNTLQNIKVEDTKIFEDKDEFSKLVDKRVTKFLSNIIETDLIKAETSFDDVLKLWELRLQFDVTKKKLTEKSERFKSTKITNTPEFTRVLEVKDTLIDYLKKNSKVISNISEIKNTVKLAYAISECFNLPRLTYDSLVEGTYKVPGRVTQNLYEHLTKMELISKELNESKQEFSSIWSTNDLVVQLVSMIYEQDQSKVYESLAKVIHQVPYFALTNKKQLNETFRTVLNMLEQEYSDIQLKKFTSFIYESKKPVKNYLLDLLSEKYGVNITNLTETPTFATLADAESVIFESLALLSPKNSNMRRVLSEMAKVLKEKNGIETIDIADFLNEVFHKAQYKQFINETSLMNYLDFNKVADDLGKIGSVLKMIQGNIAGAGGGMGGDIMGQNIGGLSQALQPQGEEEMTDDDQYGAEVDMPQEEEMGGEEMPPEEGMEGMDQLAPEGEDNDDVNSPGMDAEDAAAQAMGDDQGMDQVEADDLAGEDEEMPAEEMPEDQLLGNLKELEDMIATLKSDLGVEDMQGDDEEFAGDEEAAAFAGEETPEEEAMEDHEMGEENEENQEGDGDVNIDVDTSDADADSDSDDDEVHIDLDSHKGEENADEEEEEEEEEDEEEKQEESSHKGLKGKQHLLDMDGDKDIDGKDFKMLRRKKKQEEASKLVGNQHRLDKNKDGKLKKIDFTMLRKGKK